MCVVKDMNAGESLIFYRFSFFDTIYNLSMAPVEIPQSETPRLLNRVLYIIHIYHCNTYADCIHTAEFTRVSQHIFGDSFFMLHNL